MKAIELLNQYLDDIIILGGKQYPKEKVMRVYNKLNPPVPKGTFYEGNRVRANIQDLDGTGVVTFETYYPETGWRLKSPEESGIVSASPKPIRELIAAHRSFNNLLSSPEGRIVFENQPLSTHRAKAYETIGFSPMDGRGIQTLDNRRFQNLPAIQDMYKIVEKPVRLPEELVQNRLEIQQQETLRNLGLTADQASNEILALQSQLPPYRRLWNNSHYDLNDRLVALGVNYGSNERPPAGYVWQPPQ